MIRTPHFMICHIGKTGGDAIKQITSRLRLPECEIIAPKNGAKHHARDPRGRDLIMSIRRLPNRELSWYQHMVQYYRKRLPPPATCLLNKLDGEHAITAHLQWGDPKHYIRSEHLREDLEKVLSIYYDLTDTQRDIIHNAKTKKTMKYNRNLAAYFTDEEIAKLYELSPNWSRCEKEAYGS